MTAIESFLSPVISSFREIEPVSSDDNQNFWQELIWGISNKDLYILDVARSYLEKIFIETPEEILSQLWQQISPDDKSDILTLVSFSSQNESIGSGISELKPWKVDLFKVLEYMLFTMAEDGHYELAD